MRGETDSDRRLYRLTGPDNLIFLQGLVSNDVLPLARADGIVWAALLTPQGKYLADFFVVARGGEVLLALPAGLAEGVIRRLSMYRLRADVQIAAADDLSVTRGLAEAPADALPDPRHPALGWRAYGAPGGPAVIDWDALRVEHLIPQSGIELIPDDTYLLEAGFERLNGVDFRKGCYVGQEVTARMKHKTELRKGLVRLRITGSAPVGTEILADGKPAGTLFTQSGGRALAHMRHDRIGPGLTAADAVLAPDG